MMVSYFAAVVSLVNGTITGPENGPISEYVFESGQTPPSEEEIQAKIVELQAAEPLRQLRIQRNQLLQQTDWRMTTDYPYDDQSAWASYRTALRNLPATATPTLDEQGNLIVDWPQAPSQL